ncbi:helix-turn-helix domain-containing protein [Streptomyces noursei]|nr:helix-turn-helix domain-containing protein [Streptomyces noursei]
MKDRGESFPLGNVAPGEPLTAGEIVRSRRLALGYSQEEAALRFGASPRWWSGIENGAHITAGAAVALQHFLKMPREDADQFFGLVNGSVRFFKGIRDVGLDSVTRSWVSAHVAPLREPTVLLDGGWNLLHCNAAWAALFGDFPPHPTDHPLDNPVRFMLFHPRAQEVFLNWEQGWVFTILCQFAHHYHLNHDNPELRHMRQRISESDVLERLFTVDVRKELTTHGLDRIYASDGEVREIYVPGKGEMQCRLTTCIPWHGRWVGYQACKLSSVIKGQPLVDLPPSIYESDATVPNGLKIASEAVDSASGNHPPQARAGYQKDRDRAIAVRLTQGLRYPDVAVTVGQILRYYRELPPKIPQNRIRHVTPLKISDRKYRDLESDTALPQLDMLPTIKEALKIPTSVTRLLHRMISGGHPPTIGVRGGAEFESQARVWAREFIDDAVQPIPSSLEDGQWNVIAHNAAYAALFSHAADNENHPTKSSFRYVMFHEDARHTLANWHEEWLVPSLIEFGAKLISHGDDWHPELAQMYEEVRQDPLLWDTFNGRVRAELRNGGMDSGFLIDGGIRGFNLPTAEYDPSKPAENRKRYPVLITSSSPLHMFVNYGGQAFSAQVLEESGPFGELAPVRQLPIVPGFTARPGGLLATAG